MNVANLLLISKFSSICALYLIISIIILPFASLELALSPHCGLLSPAE